MPGKNSDGVGTLAQRWNAKVELAEAVRGPVLLVASGTIPLRHNLMATPRELESATRRRRQYQ